MTGSPAARRGTQHGAHRLIAQDRLAVVAHRDSACIAQGFIVCQSLAHAADRRRANGIDARLRAALRRLHPLRDLGGVVHRNGIGHGGDAGEAAGRRGRGAARDGFLVALSGLAQMDMDVDEAGRHDKTGRVDQLDIFRIDVELRVHGGDAAVLDQQIARRVDFVCRVDEVAAA